MQRHLRLVGLVLIALGCLGGTIVVDDDGSTPDLATALASAQPGDTVQVLPGTYNGQFEVPEGVHLLGSGSDVTVLDGQGGRTVGLFNDSTLSGFTIRGGKPGVETAFGVRIVNNVVRENENNLAFLGAGIVTTQCGREIAGNTIRNNVSSHGGGGIAVFSGLNCRPGDPRMRIYNNVITGNTATSGAGIECHAFLAEDYPEITNNTIVGNTATQPGGGAVYFRTNEGMPLISSGVLTNNVIAGNSGGGVVAYYLDNIYYSLGPPEITQNIIFGNGSPELQAYYSAIGLDGNQAVDPLFVDAAAGDYRLLEGSPGIDSGAATPETPLTDFDGFPRPLDGDLDGTQAIDIGAFESRGEVSPLDVNGDTISWQPRTDATAYHLYRGELQVLLAAGDYTQDTSVVLGARQWCDLSQASALDVENPGSQSAFFYLATPVGITEGALGFDSARQSRPSANPCP